MEDAFVVLRFEVVADLVNFVIEVTGFSKHRHKVADKKSSGDGLFVIILNERILLFDFDSLVKFILPEYRYL